MKLIEWKFRKCWKAPAESGYSCCEFHGENRGVWGFAVKKSCTDKKVIL